MAWITVPRTIQEKCDLTLACDMIKISDSSGKITRIGRTFTCGVAWQIEIVDGLLDYVYFRTRDPVTRHCFDVVAYKDNGFSETDFEYCSICMEKAEIATTCKHVFCISCLAGYFNSFAAGTVFENTGLRASAIPCPICRRVVSHFDSFSTYLSDQLLVKYHPETGAEN